MTVTEEIHMDLIELMAELLALAEQNQEDEKLDLFVAGTAMAARLAQRLRRQR